jgi:tetratricopeptide (TPR) repeat protein
LSIALRVIGVGILVMQYLYPTYLLEWMFGSLQTGTIPNALANFSLGYFKGNLMVNACAMASLCCLYLAYRLGQGGAKHVMRTDKRAPVLFLRSFGDDGKHNLNPKGLIAVLLGARPFALEKLGPYANVAPTRLWKLITGSAVDNAEEQLGSFFRKIGPFVAIGRPGEMLSQGGADRLYVEHSEWQSKVLKFMEESAIVVLQPAETEGVWWEIEQAIKNVSPRRLLVSLACYEDSQEGWDRFRLRLEKLIGKPVPRARAGALFLHFAEDWTPTLLPVFYRTPFVWPVFGLAIDLRRTLEPFLEGFSPSTPARRPATGRRMPSMLTGIPAVALWWIGFIVVGQWIFVLSYHRKALQNATRGPVKEWTAESLPFVWRLGPHWDLLGTRELPQPLANFGTENRSVVAIWQMLGPGDIGEERLLAFVQRMEAAQSRNGAPIVRRAWIERGKHRWLEAEIRTRNVPKNMLALIRCYSGPEGDMAITAATDVIAQPTVGPARKALSAVLDAFELLDRPQLAAKLSVNKEKVNLFALQRYLATGDTNSAITVCLNMLKVNPNLIVVRENLADLYLGRENLKAANEQLQEIIRSKPDHARVYYILGLIAYEEKRFVQALENYRQALRLAPESEQVRLEIAATHLALENPREAIDVLQKGRQKHQPSFTGEFRTGLAYARLKEYTNALYHFIAAETIAQTAETNRLSRKLYFELGTTSDRVGKTAESIGYLEKCLSLSSNYAPALNYLGYLWANQGTNLARAQELLEQAVKLDPTEAAYLDSLGWVLFKQGHREKALELIQTAVRLNDDPDASIYEHLGDVLTALGKHAPAREAWRRSLALEPDENVEKKLKEASPP